jgi:hypothetical protein
MPVLWECLSQQRWLPQTIASSVSARVLARSLHPACSFLHLALSFLYSQLHLSWHWGNSSRKKKKMHTKTSGPKIAFVRDFLSGSLGNQSSPFQTKYQSQLK